MLSNPHTHMYSQTRATTHVIPTPTPASPSPVNHRYASTLASEASSCSDAAFEQAPAAATAEHMGHAATAKHAENTPAKQDAEHAATALQQEAAKHGGNAATALREGATPKACLPIARAGSSLSIRSTAGSIAHEASSVSLCKAGSVGSRSGTVASRRSPARKSPPAGNGPPAGLSLMPSKGFQAQDNSLLQPPKSSAATEQSEAQSAGQQLPISCADTAESSGSKQQPVSSQRSSGIACRAAESEATVSAASNSTTPHGRARDCKENKPNTAAPAATAKLGQNTSRHVLTSACAQTCSPRQAQTAAVAKSPAAVAKSPAAVAKSPAPVSPWTRTLGSKCPSPRPKQETTSCTPQRPPQPRSPTAAASPVTKRLAGLQQRRAQVREDRVTDEPRTGPQGLLEGSEEGLSNSAEQRLLQASLARLDGRLCSLAARCRGR